MKAQEQAEGGKVEERGLEIDVWFSTKNERARKYRCVHLHENGAGCGKPCVVYAQGTGLAWCGDHQQDAVVFVTERRAMSSGRLVGIDRSK